MRKQGRASIVFTNKDKKIIEKFLESDETYAEAAARLGMTSAQFEYRVRKYKKELVANGGKTEDK